MLNNTSLFRYHSINGNANWEFSHKFDVSDLIAAVRYLELIREGIAADDAAELLDKCMTRTSSRCDQAKTNSK